MKITKTHIKNFEHEQTLWGTRIALENFQWNLSAQLMKDMGVTSIHTTRSTKRNKSSE